MPAEIYPEMGRDFFAMVANFIPSEQQLYKQMHLFKAFFESLVNRSNFESA